LTEETCHGYSEPNTNKVTNIEPEKEIALLTVLKTARLFILYMHEFKNYTCL